MQRNFPGALDCYLRAVQLHEGNMAAQFNLGKVYFHNEAFQQAEPCFEVVVNNPRHKDCYEALRLLAQTKGVLGKTDESVALFKRVLQLCPRDFEANIEIAQNYEQTDPKLALVYYESALKAATAEAEDRDMPLESILAPEIFVNLGTLRLEVGKFQEAHQAFEQAISSCDRQIASLEGEERTRLTAVRMTARFNLAYWNE